MKMKKNSFFAFCFSFIPGAAHMYMGFMKQGLSIMWLLMINIAIGGFLDLPILFAFTPVLWFYAFFDAHNKRSIPDEEFQRLEDKYLFSNTTGDDILKLVEGKSRIIVAGVLIFFGTYILLDNTISLMRSILPYRIFDIIYYNGVSKLPRLVIAVVIIYAGVRLISGKKQEFKAEQKQEILQIEEKKN